MTETPARGAAAALAGSACSLVRQLVTDWAGNRDRPFPYQEVGDHLTRCLSCLVWSTSIAHQPADKYLEAVSLRLSDLLTFLGESLLAVIAGGQGTSIRFDYPPDELTSARDMALRFLRRYEGFSDAAKTEAGRIRDMVAHAQSDSPLITLEPYELVRYFFQTALSFSPSGDKNLSLMVYLGVTENYQALNELEAGHDRPATDHFCRARGYFARVIEVDPRRFKGTASETAQFDKSALVTARINLAGTEVQQGRYSEPALRRSIELLQEARRLVYELGLSPADHTVIFSNLLISHLRLFLDHAIAGSYEDARHLAQEIVAAPELARAFLPECVQENADPELTELLARPQVSALSDLLRQQAAALRG